VKKTHQPMKFTHLKAIPHWKALGKLPLEVKTR